MRLSLATRIFVGYAVVLVTFGAVALFSITELRRNQVQSRLDAEGYLVLIQTVAALETTHKSQAQDLAKLRDEQSAETRRVIIRLARLYFPGLVTDKLGSGAKTAREAMSFAGADDRTFLQDVSKRFDDISTAYADYQAEAEKAFALLEQPGATAGESLAQLDRLQSKESAVGAAIRRLQGKLEARIRERVRLGQETERRTGVVILALSVLAIVVGLLATGIAARALKPVRTLTAGVSRIRQGDFSTTLGVQGDDEIAVLAREFDAMARALADREAQLAAKQQQLLRAEQLAAMGRMSAQVAHEVRNPLSSIGLNVEMLTDAVRQASFATPDAAKEAVQLLASVTREVDRLTEITDEYLRLARLPAPARRREDLTALVQSVVGFGKEELERSGITVAVSAPSAPVSCDLDEGQLRQVFLNLLRNAKEAMPQGGALAVSIAGAGATAQVRVADTGPGIAPAVRARIFDPFFTTKEGGTGLGLPLSRQIVEAHGGTLTLDEGAERGSCFVITLPLAAA